MKFRDFEPEISYSAFIARGARIIGKVKIEDNSSLWFNIVIRGDKDEIIIGKYSNIQDNSTLHTSPSHPVIIGNYVTIGHNCVIHGAEIKNNVLIGMGAIIMNGSRIGENSIVGAGALVTENKKFPPNSLILGFPAKIKRTITQEEIESIKNNALNYVRLAEEYR
ncbi:2,3,4,5-tetrahydropyridine-2,6-dicarboxylate N-acetyltransferase [archaeon BMS3Bbin15]|nr:2,3,4,5-tetrahydropyridine-2,6-dicarboxylate N-acetyltransferase [archaeon BMS3Bbin15]